MQFLSFRPNRLVTTTKPRRIDEHFAIHRTERPTRFEPSTPHSGARWDAGSERGSLA